MYSAGGYSSSDAISGEAEAKEEAAAWIDLNRRVLLAVTHLEALETEVFARRNTKCGPWLPHIDLFGARSVLNVPWRNDPASSVRHEAVKRGIISEAELKEARRVK